MRRWLKIAAVLAVALDFLTPGIGFIGGAFDFAAPEAKAAGLPANVFQFTPVNPSAQTSTTGIMAGVGLANSFLPHYDGVALVIITGTALPSAAGTATVQLAYGTGAAPANNASPVGSTCGGAGVYTMGATTGYAVPFTVVCAVTGMVLNTGYWFDLNAKSSAGTLTLTNIGITAVEQ